MSRLIKNAKLVLEKEIVKGDLRIKDGLINKIGSNLSAASNDQIIEAEGKYLLPGFIDIHNHGAAGFDFSFGKYNTELDSFDQSEIAFQEALEKALEFYHENGVTKVLLTTMAAPLDILEDAFKQLRKYIDEKRPYYGIIEGINLEGTFLKDPLYAGAQNPKFFREVSSAIVDRFQIASGGLLKIVNIPPNMARKVCILSRA